MQTYRIDFENEKKKREPKTTLPNIIWWNLEIQLQYRSSDSSSNLTEPNKLLLAALFQFLSAFKMLRDIAMLSDASCDGNYIR